MEACRSLGIAARSLSGYLSDDRLFGSENPMVGGDATHAWCEVYIPGAGWTEFAPTNGLMAGRTLDPGGGHLHARTDLADQRLFQRRSGRRP